MESNGDRQDGSRAHYGEMTLEQALVTAKLACSQVRDDPGAVYAADVLYALALLKQFDKQNWARLKRIITGAKVALKELLPLFPAVTLATSDRAEHLQDLDDDDLPIEGGDVQFAGDMLDDCPFPLLRIPAAYRLTRSATVRLREDAEGAKTPHVVAFAPVLITGRLQDAVTTQESLLTSWRWPGQGWRSEVVRRGQAMNGRQLATLADIGFPVADDNLKDLVGYLHRLEAYNRRALPCAAVSAHLGWQGDDGQKGFLVGRTLVHPDGAIEPAGILDTERPDTWSEKRIAFHGLSEGDEQIVDAFHSRGTWEGWLDTVKQLAPYPKALVCFYAGFAPPLLALLGVPNFIIDLWCRTTTGKTTSLRGAASIWGNPDERCPDSVIAKWNASKVFVERASHVLSGLPLILDDTKDVRRPEHVAEIIYAVASGRGRGRGTIQGLARTVSFRTILFSTGEQPAVSFGQDGGARTRTIEVAGMPFGAASAETAAVVARLNTGFMAHYGHAGTRFLQWLMRERANFTRWEALYQKGLAWYSERPPSAEAGRLAAYAALISLAGKMAHEALALPWTFTDPMGSLWEDVAKDAADAAGEVRAMQDILSFASSRTNAFATLSASGSWRQPPPNVTRLGRWDVTNPQQWEYLALYPTALREVLKGMGYDYDPIIAGWAERHWIQIGKDKKPTIPTKPGDGEAATRMVRILRAAVEEINPPDPDDPAEAPAQLSTEGVG